MKSYALATAIVLALTLGAVAQDEFTVRAEPRSAFIWGSDSLPGAVSSIARDPLTGEALHKISYSGIEVSAKFGYERIARGLAGDLLAYTTTISNATERDVSVRYGGVSVDGHPAMPLWVLAPEKKVPGAERKKAWDLSRIQCFTTGFLPDENVFSPSAPSKVFTVPGKRAMSFSAVIKDPRNYGMRCSIQGCYPVGITRYFINVNGKDYVFIWEGQSAVYCGE
jgi:hypothetical protein